MMALGSLWRSLWHSHRLLAAVLVAEYALTFAMFATATGLLMTRVQAIESNSGVHANGLYVVEARGMAQPVHRFQMVDARKRFAAVVGVSRVALGSSVPFLGRNRHVMPMRVPTDKQQRNSISINAYLGDTRFADVLGVRLLRGRWFRPDEIARQFGSQTHLIILSKALAEHLFPDRRAVGEQVQLGGTMHTVTGVISSLAAPEYLGQPQTNYTVVLPEFPGGSNVLLVRYEGQNRKLDRVLTDLRKDYSGKLSWSLTPYSAIRSTYFRMDRLAVGMLAGVLILVLLAALCGTLGLTNYWVANRRPQIAVRRALGATKRDIQHHFLAESSLLAGIGVLFGTVIAMPAGLFLTPNHSHDNAGYWVISIAVLLLLAVIVVHTSLRHWMRMDPAALMRKI